MDWEFINGFSGWASAVTTLLAVIVSLCVSYSTRKVRMAIKSAIYIFNEQGKDVEYLVFFIQNTGFRTFHLNHHSCIVLRIGFFRKKFIGIGNSRIDFSKSSTFPCRLSEGDQINLFIRLHNGDGYWIDQLKKDFFSGYSLSSLRIVVFPGIGKHVAKRFDREVIREFR